MWRSRTGAAVQALRADENVELVAMADAFKDRLKALMLLNRNLKGKRKLKLKKNMLVGFNGYGVDLADVVIRNTARL